MNELKEFNDEVNKLSSKFNERRGVEVLNGDIESLRENLEALAKKEYEDIVRLFVDKNGKIKNKYSTEDKIQDVLWSLVSKEKRGQFQQKTDERIVDESINSRLNYVKEKCRDTNTKLRHAESSYEFHLEQLTQMRVECVEWSDYAEKFDKLLQEGKKHFEEIKKGLNDALQQKEIEKAKELQKEMIYLDKSLRTLERKKTDSASKSVSLSNRLFYVKTCYARARAYKDILEQNKTVLEQLTEHISTRIEQYRKSGNLTDIVEYVKIGNEMKDTKETFDDNFRQSYPLLQQAEKAYNELARQNNCSDNVNFERNQRDEDLFRKALNAREEAVKMEV